MLATSAFWFGVVKWVGVAYLAWLGIQMLRTAGHFHATLDDPKAAYRDVEGSPRRIFQKSFLVAVTNPKGYLFFAAFLPQFIDLAQPLPAQYATLALIFVSVDIAVMVTYAVLGSQAMRFLQQKGALWLERGCGVTLIVLAAALASYRRATT